MDKMTLALRFRGFMPVVVDVECGGFDAKKDALLEMACVPILMNESGILYSGVTVNAHFEPFAGANVDPAALKFTGIQLDSPFRKSISCDEKTGLRQMFRELNAVRKAHNCKKCILVGHNAHFDLGFVNAAIERTKSKNQSPFHPFSVLDTASLSALAFGQTVLARAMEATGLEFDAGSAHSAVYDAQKTAELFCHIFNQTPMLKSPLTQMQNNPKKDLTPIQNML